MFKENFESFGTTSEEVFEDILNRLNSFEKPDMNIIYLAKEYIAKLKEEGAKESNEEERDGAFSGGLKKKLAKKFKGCVGCGKGTLGGQSRHDPVLQPHHIKPREFGGKTTNENAMIVCRDCHVMIHSV
jgi:hypothetical protein